MFADLYATALQDLITAFAEEDYSAAQVCANTHGTRVRQREGPLKQWLIPLPDDLRSEFSCSDEVLWKSDEEAERHG